MKQQDNNGYKHHSLRIVFIYALFGITWILFSDRAIELLFPEVRIEHFLQTIKGGFFVIITSILLYFLIDAYLKKQNALFQKYQQTITEKEHLFRELNHRIKNNLQTILSLIKLETNTGCDDGQNSGMDRLFNRVRSIVSIHDKLAHTDTVAPIDLSEYIDAMLNDYTSLYSVFKDGIQLKRDIESFDVQYGLAVDIGMIVSELLLNSIKYGISSQDNPYILVSIKYKKKMLHISVENNGPPFKLDSQRTGSLGLKIIENIISKYKGSLHISSTDVTRTEIKLHVVPFNDNHTFSNK